MAEKKISLFKKIISNQKSFNIQEGDFKELILSEEEINDDKLKDIYEELFYTIPKEGDESHEFVLIQSNEALYPEINENLDNDIKLLEQNLLEKNEEYLNKTLPELLQIHPVFPNGIFIQEGNTNNNTPIDPESTIWFVQQGYRRALLGSNKEFWTQLIRKSIGDKTIDPIGNSLPLSPPNIRYSTPEDIMTLKEGQDIATGADISITPIIAKEEQTAIFSMLNLALHCKGVERWYSFEEDEEPVKVSRDALLYGGQDPLSQAFYDQPKNKEYKVRPNMGAGQSFEYTEEWGEGKKFPSITHIKEGSHVFASIKEPSTSTEGNPLSSTTTGFNYTHLNGIDQYEPQPNVPGGQLNILNNYYYKTSGYGTQMIQRNCYGPLADECYGDLGHNNELQELFNDPTFNYYRTNIQTSYRSDNGDKDWPGGKRGKRGDIGGGGGYVPKIYGQPILKVGGKGSNPWTYSVFVGGYRRDDGSRDYAIFYDLEYGDFWRIKDTKWNEDNDDDSIKGYSNAYNSRVFQWFRPNFYQYGYDQPGTEASDYHINNPKLYYPGLYAQELNWWWSDIDLYMCSMDHNWGCGGQLDDIHTWQIQNQTMLHTDYPPTSISGRGNSNFTLGQMGVILDGV